MESPPAPVGAKKHPAKLARRKAVHGVFSALDGGWLIGSPGHAFAGKALHPA